MKKQLLSNAFLMLSFSAFAQPSLTSDKMLPYGSVMQETYITNYAMIDTTSRGANISWDFSTVTLDPDASVLNVAIVNPSTTPDASTFTNANYGYHETYGSSEEYVYFSLTSSKMQRLGSYQSGSTVTYSDPQIEYVFPLALNTVNNDTWDNSQSISGGIYDLSCVATGSLKLPGATYANVLLVKVHSTEVPYIDFYTFFWYNADNGAVLFEYIVGDNVFINTEASYLSNLTIGTGTIVTASTNASYMKDITYNNPVSSTLDVNFGNQTSFSGKYNVTTALGETVKKGEASSQQTLQVACNDLKAGIYLITFYEEQNSDQKKTIRFVKQ